MLELTDMDYIRSAIAQLMADGLEIDDAWRVAEHAETPQDMDNAANILCAATHEPKGRAWCNRTNQWVTIGPAMNDGQ